MKAIKVICPDCITKTFIGQYKESAKCPSCKLVWTWQDGDRVHCTNCKKQGSHIDNSKLLLFDVGNDNYLCNKCLTEPEKKDLTRIYNCYKFDHLNERKHYNDDI